MLLLDGYNVLHQFFRGGRIEAADMASKREELLEALEVYSVRKRRNILVVFDSGADAPPFPVRRQIRRGRLAQLTTPRGVTADEVIMDEIAAQIDRKAIKVVSSDRVIRNAADRHRIEAQTSEDFVRELESFLRTTRSVYDEEKLNGLSEGEADYWLREFGLDEKGLEELLG